MVFKSWRMLGAVDSFGFCMDMCALAIPFPSIFSPPRPDIVYVFISHFLYPHHLDTTVVIAAFLDSTHARRIGFRRTGYNRPSSDASRRPSFHLLIFTRDTSIPSRPFITTLTNFPYHSLPAYTQSHFHAHPAAVRPCCPTRCVTLISVISHRKSISGTSFLRTVSLNLKDNKVRNSRWTQ
jgi:hypothetical protein